MRRSRYQLTNVLLLLSILILGLYCNKENTPPVSKVEVTTTIGTIHLNSVVCGGEITSNNVQEIIERGVCWDTLSSPLVTANKIVCGKGPGKISTEIVDLLSGRDYYIRVYAQTSNSVIYGNEIKFKTLALASIQSAPMTGISSTGATFTGEVVSDGGAEITEKGVCWNITSNPTTANSKISAGSGTGAFTVQLTGLSMATSYYARGYAISLAGTSYGNEIRFTTLGPPIISTVAPTEIMQHNSVSGGNISSDGGTPVTERGVCWGTETMPTVAGSKTSDGTGVGLFTSNVTGLTQNTTYYIRAYATNGVGTSYGEEISFTTKDLSVPTVITLPITNITQFSAQSGGNITADGGTPILQRGICYSDYVGVPTIDQSLVRVTKDGTGSGMYISSTNLLYPFTWYSLRAYATNAVGTAYGQVITFNTLPAEQVPPVLRSPRYNSTISCCYVDFTWDVSVYAEFSTIEVSFKDDFSEPKYFSETLRTSGVYSTSMGGTSYRIRMDDSTLNGTWYWRVRSTAAGTPSAWSGTGVFIFHN